MKNPHIGIAPQLLKDNKAGLLPEYALLLQAYEIDYSLLPFEDEDDMFAPFDGFLIPGGDDINPQLYGQKPLSTTQVPLVCRDELEGRLATFCLGTDTPLLGICRGLQMINVTCGGTLYQHLVTQMMGALEHWPGTGDINSNNPVHDVTVVAHSFLNPSPNVQLFSVNSKHNQGINTLGEGLKAIAYSRDNLVEAAQHSKASFIAGVQWHPELISDNPLTEMLMKAYKEALVSHMNNTKRSTSK